MTTYNQTQPLLEQLDERRSEESRYRAARKLTGQSPEDVPALLAFLGDPSWRVRKAAVAILLSLQESATVIAALSAGLASSDNAGLRNSCAEALMKLGPACVPTLAHDLNTPDPDHRKFIVEVLGAIGSSTARQVLVKHLQDPDGNVRAAVAEALGRIGGQESITALKDSLEHCGQDLMQMVYLLDALGAAKTKFPYEFIVPYLNQPGLDRQTYTLLALGQDPRSLPHLLDGLGKGPKASRAAAARALANILHATDHTNLDFFQKQLSPDSPARSFLLDLLSDEDDVNVESAVRVLGYLKDPDLAPIILKACACRKMVELALENVVKWGIDVVPILLSKIDDVDIESRVLFIEVIEVLGNEQIVDSLIEIAKSPDTRSSEAAIRVVGGLANTQYIEPLMELLRQRDGELRKAVTMALASLGSRYPDEVANAVRTTFLAGDNRPEWLLILGTIGRNEDIGVVVSGVHHRDPEVRWAAVEAGRNFGIDFPEVTLIFTLTDEHPKVRASSARALCDHRSSISLDSLLASVKDRDPWVAAAALEALGRRRDPKAIHVLLDAVQHGTSPIAIAALKSLFLMNPPQLPDALLLAIGNKDPEVVREAIAAAQRLSSVHAGPLFVRCLNSEYWNVRAAAAEALANRKIEVPASLVHEALLRETESLAQESIARLLPSERGLI